MNLTKYEDADMRHGLGDIDIETCTWGHGDMETQKHGDMETRRHGAMRINMDMDIDMVIDVEMDIETWRHEHGDM